MSCLFVVVNRFEDGTLGRDGKQQWESAVNPVTDIYLVSLTGRRSRTGGGGGGRKYLVSGVDDPSWLEGDDPIVFDQVESVEIEVRGAMMHPEGKG